MIIDENTINQIENIDEFVAGICVSYSRTICHAFIAGAHLFKETDGESAIKTMVAAFLAHLEQEKGNIQ